MISGIDYDWKRSENVVTIIDYGMGNLFSASKACQYLGEETELAGTPEKIVKAEKLILPGVGAFGEAMKNLRDRGLEQPVKEAVSNGVPILGICLGMQLMFRSSDEAPGVAGLSLFDDDVTRFPQEAGGKRLKVPHMGWNSLKVNGSPVLFKGIKDGEQVYFVHSFCAEGVSSEYTAASTVYGVEFTSAAERGNVFATQFHPEKSGAVGLRILDNFLKF